MSSAVLRAIFATWARVSSILADASMPSTRRGRSLPGEAGDHAGVGRTGDAADDDRVEEDAEFSLLLLHLVGPVREAQAAEPVIGRAGRDRVRHAALRRGSRRARAPSSP